MISVNSGVDWQVDEQAITRSGLARLFSLVFFMYVLLPPSGGPSPL